MDPDKLPGTRRQCRRCGIRLTTKNARTYDGRGVGACRECENAETRERQAKEVWTCPTCGHRKRLTGSELLERRGLA
jgi:hypothetical protein